ncbi:hypothetical protein [Sedimenticola selenatireducens]|uniref:Uncharacterized protein n=1 Tax=Sedimenticola selenatireducens TaxID=191960 RepID=A0A557SD34_9GAMM|nr:hypothetical protein [Sedimenticola selenatireducens]TVO75304.1 hypothetical protein FHP88_09885 [Sedimenticola selenatireducens]TVT66843.1 MAG: hypothetical protein FHK78_00475 [Sedimenticola selenatireducens]
MPVQRYDIYFSGKIIEDADLTTVKQKIAKLFNAGDEQLDYLFSGVSVKIKNNIDQDTAIKYRVAFRDAGALVEIRSADPIDAAQPEAAANSNRHDHPETAMTLLPPNTGSLIDCAPTIEPADIPNTDYLTLANSGAVLDESPTPSPVDIDISELTLAPANSGTLEEYQIKKQAAPLPDISQLRIVETND